MPIIAKTHEKKGIDSSPFPHSHRLLVPSFDPVQERFPKAHSHALPSSVVAWRLSTRNLSRLEGRRLRYWSMVSVAKCRFMAKLEQTKNEKWPGCKLFVNCISIRFLSNNSLSAAAILSPETSIFPKETQGAVERDRSLRSPLCLFNRA